MLEVENGPIAADGIRLWTVRVAYNSILAGRDPWYGLSKFSHHWFGAYRDYRVELVREAIEIPENPTAEQWRWAVWCAASAEFLCCRAGLEVPPWAMDERFHLVDPWYADDVLPEEEEELREETPEAFFRRGIFCEANPYRNKYEWQGREAAQAAREVA